MEILCHPSADSPLGDVQSGEEISPFLFENTRYELILKTEGSHLSLAVPGADLIHTQEVGSVLVRHYAINFANNVGFTEFVIGAGADVSAKAVVEVFPFKIDYRTDYQHLRDEIGTISLGLAVSAMKKTYDLGAPSLASNPTLAEWAALLRGYQEELVATLRAILVGPHSTVVRQTRQVNVARARRLDEARLAAQLRRRPKRVGAVVAGVPLPVTVPERYHQVSYDTPANRYLKASAAVLELRLRDVLRVAGETDGEESMTARQGFCRGLADTATAALQGLSGVMGDPMWSEVSQVPPVPPRSNVLLTHPLYSRAAKMLRLLAGGVSFDGPALRTPVKDVATLYEYWCFLKVVDLLRGRLTLERDTIISTRQLEVELTIQRGMESAAWFSDPETGHSIRLAYNPIFRGLPTVPQRPDLWLEAEGGNTLVLDPKYRLATDPEYIKTYGVVGPPAETINTMHRYRDAIVSAGPSHRRRVSMAVALFPFADEDAYEDHRFFKSIASVGVGAAPFMPGATRLVEELLDSWIAATRSEATASGPIEKDKRPLDADS